jgi:cytochrome bd ubiquinol oxidase subunit II
MLYVVIIFLLLSVYIYCLLGGADFGAGIIELTADKTTREKTGELVSSAMAPIWEANHMWLIITVVILFNAFPNIYTDVAVSLAIPLVLMLVGIVLRSSAFTFRHYDAVKDSSQKVYSVVFHYSSLIVPLFFGSIVGAVVSGKIVLHPSTFYEGYVAPWFNIFSLSVGIFVACLFAFIAAVFLISESTDKDAIDKFISKSKRAIVATVISGGLVFISSIIEKVGFAEQFFTNILSIILIVLATASLPLLWKILSKGLKWASRFIAGAQLLFILGAFYAVYFPTIVRIKDGTDLTLYNSAAGDVTLFYLGLALLLGSLIIFPLLFLLFNVFKSAKERSGKTSKFFFKL